MRIALYMDMEAGYTPAVVRGIASYARPHLPWMFRAFSSARSDLAAISSWSADAVICCIHQEDQARDVHGLGIPAVNVGRYFPNLAMAHVANDDLVIGRMGAQHFLDRGFRNLGFVMEQGIPPDHGRRVGFSEAVADAGYIAQVFDGEEKRLEAWLASLPHPAGVMALGDSLAWQVIEAAREAGLDVPHEIAVLGVDNADPLYAICYPPLSSIAVAAERIGYEAASMLARILSGDAIDSPVYLPPIGIVTRQSSDAIAVADPALSLAVRYIREHCAEQIDIDDVCRHVSVNRRSLERKFRQYLGRTPLDELQHARVERARHLLADTDLGMDELASLAGLADARQLLHVFRRVTGQTPSDYRRLFRRSP